PRHDEGGARRGRARARGLRDRVGRRARGGRAPRGAPALLRHVRARPRARPRARALRGRGRARDEHAGAALRARSRHAPRRRARGPRAPRSREAERRGELRRAGALPRGDPPRLRARSSRAARRRTDRAPRGRSAPSMNELAWRVLGAVFFLGVIAWRLGWWWDGGSAVFWVETSVYALIVLAYVRRTPAYERAHGALEVLLPLVGAVAPFALLAAPWRPVVSE